MNNFYLSLAVLLTLSAIFVPATSVYSAEGVSEVETLHRGVSEAGGSIKLANPLGDIDSFQELIEAILKAAMIIGLPVAVLFIVFAGFRFVWARGNSSELQKAKTNLLWTVIGIAVFFGAWIITDVIVNTLKDVGVVFK